ncbi:MAG: ABC transporter permease [Cellulomonas sp.]|nr:ABC transporter permease [Cellulomonas sp.]
MSAADPTRTSAGPVHSARGTSVLHRTLRDPRAVAGALAALAVLVLAVAGPWFVTTSPTAFVGAPFDGPSPGSPLGTDVLGRDVLSRLLVGGRTFVLEGFGATLLGVGLGALLGTGMAVLPTRTGQWLLTLNDTFIVIPQILVSLLVITRFGASPTVLVAVVAVAHVPHTARVMRAAAQRVVEEDYVAAARGFGTPRGRILTHEVLPVVAPTLLVELGVRLAASFVLLASLNFLGFGSSGLEWGRMIQDNKGGVSVQPWAVLAPVGVLAVLLIGMNLLRDGVSRAISARSAR